MRKTTVFILLIAMFVMQFGAINVRAEGFTVSSIMVNKNQSDKVSNIDSQNPFIDIVFSENVDGSTVSDDSIIIKDVATGNPVEYDVYSVSDDTVKIYLGELTGAKSELAEDIVEYEITVTNLVKSAASGIEATELKQTFSVNEIINVPYVEGKIITNVALEDDVYTATGELLSSTLTNPGNLTGFTDLPASGDARRGVVDLGNYYDVVGVGVLWYPTTSPLANANDVKYSSSLIAPWLPEAETETFIEPKVLFDATEEIRGKAGTHYPITADNGASRRARYISLEKAGKYNNAYYKRLRVYAYVDVDYRDWQATLNDQLVGGITTNGNYTIKLPVNAYFTGDSYYVLVASYDNYGKIISKDVMKKDIVETGDNSYTYTFEVTDNVVAIKAMCLSSLYEGKNLTPQFEIRRAGYELPIIETNEKIEHSEDEESTSVYGNTDFYAYDENINIIMVNKDTAYDEYIQPTDILSFDSAIIKDEEHFILKAYTDGGEFYNVQFTAEKANGEITHTGMALNFVTTQMIEEMATSFETVESKSDLENALSFYVDTKGWLSLSTIPEISSTVTDTFAEKYILLGKNDDFSSLSGSRDILNRLKSAYVLSQIGEAGFYCALQAYASSIPENLVKAEYIKNEELATAFANIYDEICQNNNEYTDVAKALKWSAILSVLGYGVVDDKVDIFNDYSDTLDSDNSLITYMQSKTSSKTGMPITLEEVMEVFEFDNVADVYGTEAFGNTFKRLVDEIVYAFNVLSISPADNSVGLTNIGVQDALITISFNQVVDPETVNSKSIVITPEGGQAVEYEIYEVNDKTVKIPIAALHSNKEHTIKLLKNQVGSTDGYKLKADVVFTLSAGQVVNCQYVPNKVLIDVAEGKGVYNDKGIRAVEGRYSISRITVNDSSLASLAHFATVQGAIIDLGNYYDVVGIGYLPHTNATADKCSFAGTLEFPAVEFSEYGNLIKEAKLSAPTTEVLEIFPLDNKSSKRSRYIYVSKKTTEDVYLRQVKVYAYVDVYCEDWIAEHNGSNVYSIDANGTYNIKLPIKSYSLQPEERIVLIAAYDENGDMIPGKSYFYKSELAAKGNETVRWQCQVGDDVQFIKGICIDKINDGKYMTLPYIIKRDNTSSFNIDTDKKIEYSYDDGSFSFFGDKSKYDNSDILGMIALENGKEFASATVSDISYFDIADGNGEEKFRFVYKASTPGSYNVCFRTQSSDNMVENTFNTLRVLSGAETTTLIDGFKGVNNTSDLNAVITQYTETTPLMALDMIPELQSGVDETVGKYYVYLLNTDSYGNDMDDTSDIIRLLQMSHILSSIETDDAESAFEAAKKYKSAINADILDFGCLENKTKTAKFQTSYNLLKDEVDTSEDLVSVIKWSEMFSNFIGASPESIANTITNYETLVDPSGTLEKYMSGKISSGTGQTVTLTEVAKLFDTENLKQYYGTENFGAKFKNYVDSITSSDKQESVSISGGSSGGSGTLVSFDRNSGSEVSNVGVIENPGASVTNTVEFNDLRGYEWATDAISVLAGYGVINGTTVDKFEPERNVTREEFVKMCVCAMKLNMISSEKPAFKDYKADEWFVPYIQIAVSNDVINGIDENKFGVGMSITREDSAVIIARSMSASGYKTLNKSELTFTDNVSISSYAYDAIAKLHYDRIINGYTGGTFSPKNTITRAEAAVMIYRAFTVVNGGAK